jgi:hypothetical protein
MSALRPKRFVGHEWPIIYDGWSWAKRGIHSNDFSSVCMPLSGSATLDPRLGVVGFVRGWALLGWTLLISSK